MILREHKNLGASALSLMLSSYLGIFTWTTGIVRRLQFAGVTTIAWAMPFSYALSVFWEPSLRIRLQYHG